MESAFWSGFLLNDFLFSRVNITTPEQLLGVCILTSAVAFCFEATRTLRDWLYLKFLTKRSCNETENGASDSVMVLQDLKSQHNGKSHNNGTGDEKKNGCEDHTKQNDNIPAKPNCDKSSPTTVVSQVPVIATGNLRSSGKGCQRPQFHVGLLELLCSTLLHMCQVCLGYALMLVVMTFNIWIFLAVLIGVGVGFFVFDGFNKKIHALRISTK